MASIGALKTRLQNTLNRQAQVFLRTESINSGGTSYNVLAVDTTAGTFTVSGDQTANPDLASGQSVYVNGSTANDAIFTVASTSLDGSGDTEIDVSEDVKDGTADGTIYTDTTYEYVNVGRVQESSFGTEPITSDMDQDGRTSSQLFECTLQFTLMQASNEELSTIPDLTRPDAGGNTALYPRGYEFYNDGHFIYFSGTSDIATSTVNAAVADTDDDATDGELQTNDTQYDLAEDVNGLLFQGLFLNSTANLNFSGDISLIPLEAQARINVDEFDDVDSLRKLAFTASNNFDYV